jgi:uncharacterized protein YjgD (DUF1641 family)
MSDTTQYEVPPELERTIAEHPEEVARFLTRLGLVNSLLDTTELVAAGLDDEMVMTLAGTATNLGAAADGAATPELASLGTAVGENATDLAAAVETITELQRSGTLDDLAAAADTISLLSGALDDDMVMHLAATGSRLGEVVDTAAAPETARGIEHLLAAVGEAEAATPQRVGTIGLLRALRDPEVQAGLGYVLALARAMGRER